MFHQGRLFLPVLSCPRKLILSVLLSPQRLFLLVKFHSLRSYQTSYLLLLTSTSEDVPASELVPTDVIPDQLSAASDESSESVPASHVPPVEAVPEHTAPPS